jgi:hypothetical protein
VTTSFAKRLRNRGLPELPTWLDQAASKVSLGLVSSIDG